MTVDLGGGERTRRRLGALYEILRPFAFTASVIPVLAGAALAWVDDLWNWAPFIAALLGAVFLHAGTNIVNEVYDVRKGVDTITSPRASHAIVKGRMSERTALLIAGIFFALAIAVGLYLVWLRGPAIIVLGLLGLIGGWGYTAPPLEYKNRALGVPIVFLLMGPLMVEGSYFAVSGEWSLTALVLSIPVGLLVAAILHGNEWRDIREDSRAGISTLSGRIGRRWAHYGYVGARARRVHRPGALGHRRCPAGLDDARDPVAAVPGRGHPFRRAGRHRPAAGDRDDRPADGAAPPRLRVAARARARPLEVARCAERGAAASASAGRARSARGALAVGLVAAQAAFAATFRGPRTSVLAADDDDRARRSGRWRSLTSQPARATRIGPKEVALGPRLGGDAVRDVQGR